jgi:Domain of unknown function (DUF4440)
MTIDRRQLIVVALASAGVATVTPAFAQSTDKTLDKVPDTAGDTAAVTEAVSNLTKAMLAADKPKLEALTADELSYGHSSGVVQTKSAFIDVIVNKQTVYKSIELSSASIVLAGSNAVVRHNWLGESGPADGSKWTVSKIGILQVWQKKGSDWKLLARQAYPRSVT